jgi:cytochrome b involved in lipid metabolism
MAPQQHAGKGVKVTIETGDGTITTIHHAGGAGGVHHKTTTTTAADDDKLKWSVPKVANRTPTDSGAAAPPAAATRVMKEYTLAEVAKHNTEGDCWVAVNGVVLDATSFLPDHPGGKMAIITFAGKDATEEFNMLHERNVVEKYAAECIIGTLKPQSKL